MGLKLKETSDARRIARYVYHSPLFNLYTICCISISLLSTSVRFTVYMHLYITPLGLVVRFLFQQYKSICTAKTRNGYNYIIKVFSFQKGKYLTVFLLIITILRPHLDKIYLRNCKTYRFQVNTLYRCHKHYSELIL